MNVVNKLGAVAGLAEEIVRRLTVPVEASGRHVHLSRSDVDALFGAGYVLTRKKELSQPGQFACAERVDVVGPKGTLKNVVVLGPERGESQVEVSLSDAVALGATPPVRLSGDLADTPGILLQNGAQKRALPRGLIVARRHIHMTPDDAEKFAVKNGQTVSLRCLSARPLTLGETVVRVSEGFSTAVHLDYDEANAAGYRPGDRALIDG